MALAARTLQPKASAAGSSRRLVLPVAACAESNGQAQASAALRRRAMLGVAAGAALAPLLQAAGPRAAAADEAAASSSAPAAPAGKLDITVVDDQPGSGTATARRGDLVLLHYVGRTADGLFDSTLGGQSYRDGGKGALRPAIITIGGSPVPGICEGLQRGVEGMRVGGRRTFKVPAGLGFGSGTVLGPYGIVPGGSELTYEVQLLRLSRRGPDALMSGISQCGGGFANERTAGCADIQPAEFL